jgi:hypothetical protein
VSFFQGCEEQLSRNSGGRIKRSCQKQVVFAMIAVLSILTGPHTHTTTSCIDRLSSQAWRTQGSEAEAEAKVEKTPSYCSHSLSTWMCCGKELEDIGRDSVNSHRSAHVGKSTASGSLSHLFGFCSTAVEVRKYYALQYGEHWMRITPTTFVCLRPHVPTCKN